MRNIYFFLIFIFLFYSCKNKDKNIYTTSPNGLVAINFNIKNSIPIFNLSANQDTVITDSELGFECSELDLENKPIKIDSISHISIDENWKLPWGEKVNVKNKFNETKVYLSIGESAKFRYSLQFRAYDDGVAFRYIFPEQNNIDSLQISKEKTTFNFKEDNLCWWIPGDWDSYEHLYTKSKISEINATSKRNHPNLISSYIPYNAVNTPVTMKTPKGYYLSFHEAALYNYPGMTLKVDTNKLSMTSELVGGRDKKIKAKVKLPFKTPWRTIQVAKKPENLITSDLILNLNEPNKLKNIDWIKPMKYVGIWWQMHVGAWSWDYGTGKHGATTENTKKYIDFASNNNIQGILVEGWNKDWKKWYSGIDREKIFSFIKPYPDYDLEEIINYAKKKGVELIVHHETASAPRAYENQMIKAYEMMNKNGLHYIKTGYVGNIIPKGEHHHGQWMVNHYNKVIQTAAKYNIAVDIHEPIKQTGIRRTYPNL
ncbi:MAG TPA: glycoside hydrolase family 97 protein, partial [Bacteroidetes bacterium]|nr:glycoside hydrolase family 97 protein [Bacteroidota bacterium]